MKFKTVAISYKEAFESEKVNESSILGQFVGKAVSVRSFMAALNVDPEFLNFRRNSLFSRIKQRIQLILFCKITFFGCHELYSGKTEQQSFLNARLCQSNYSIIDLYAIIIGVIGKFQEQDHLKKL